MELQANPQIIIAISSTTIFEFWVARKIFDITKSYDKTVLTLQHMQEHGCDYESSLKELKWNSTTS